MGSATFLISFPAELAVLNFRVEDSRSAMWSAVSSLTEVALAASANLAEANNVNSRNPPCTHLCHLHGIQIFPAYTHRLQSLVEPDGAPSL